MDAFGYGFFIPIFFIHVGSRLDLRLLATLASSLALVPILLLAAYAVKVLPALLYRFSYRWRETLGAGFLLSARLSLIIAAAAIGMDLGLVYPVTCTLSPLLFERFVPTAPPIRRSGVVIVGADDLGLSLAERLRPHAEPVTVVDVNPRRCLKAERLGAEIVCGDARRHETLAQAGLEQARVLVCVLRNAERALEICRVARQEFAPPVLIAWLEDAGRRPIFQDLGVRTIVPTLAAVEGLENMVRYPDAFLFLSDLEEEGERIVRECFLEHSRWDDRPLREVPLPEEVLVLAIRRGRQLVVPRGSSRLRRGDALTLMGSPAAVEQAVERCRET